jgi:SAM-dependent methyltransferase
MESDIVPPCHYHAGRCRAVSIRRELDEAYRGQDHLWWHSSTPPKELVAAVDDGWLSLPGPVLDVGCGLGTEVAFLTTRGFRAVGIDLAEAAVRRAAHRHRLTAAFCVADATQLPFREGAFEAALDRGTFHYLSPEARRAYESELWRVLHPRGKLFLRACLRSAGVRNDIDAALLRSAFRRWREVSLEPASIESDTRSMDALITRLERP